MSSYKEYQAMIEQGLIDNHIIYQMAKKDNDPQDIENAELIEDHNVKVRNNIKAYYGVRK